MPPGKRWLAAALAMALLPFLPAVMPSAFAEVEVDLLKPDVPTGTTFYGVCWKRDGSEALMVGDDAMVLTYRASSGRFTRVEDASLPRFLFGTAWRPDSLYALIVGADGAVFAFNGQTLAPYCSTRPDYLRSVDWKTDSSEALIVGTGGTILRFRDGSFQAVASGTDVDLFSCSWHPRDGSALISGAGGTLLKLGAEGTVTVVPFQINQSLYSVSWNPEGSKALITGNDSIIAIYDGAKVDVLTQNVPYRLLGCCWNPDGATGLICGGNSMLLKYYGGKLTLINTGLGEAPQLYGVRYRPQGDFALVAGYMRTVLRYPMQPKSSPPCLLQNPQAIAALVLIPVGLILGYYYIEKRGTRLSGPEPGEERRSRRKKRKR